MTNTTNPTYDVFISYSRRDEAWVTGALLPRLEKAGLRVCIDFRDFIPGKPALMNMQDAVKNSRHTLLVLTPAWVESQWTLYESLLIRTQDPAGLQRRTVPLRLQPCDIPDFISMLTYVDFTRPDRLDTAWSRLLTALGAPDAASRERHAPAQETGTPEGVADRERTERALDMARRALDILEEQAAGFGALHAPAHLLIELEEKRREVAELERRLQDK